MQLQKQDSTPADSLPQWRKVIFDLKKLGKSLANALAASLQAYELHLLRNEAFLAAVWVSDALYGGLPKYKCLHSLVSKL